MKAFAFTAARPALEAETSFHYPIPPRTDGSANISIVKQETVLS
jgi:hypothetical protein